MGKGRKPNCPKSLKPKSSNLLQLGKTKDQSSRLSDWIWPLSMISSNAGILIDKEEINEEGRQNISPLWKIQTELSETRLSKFTKCLCIFKRGSAAFSPHLKLPTCYWLGTQCASFTATSGKTAFPVSSVNDVGACPSGSEVARFNLLGLLKDFLSIPAEKSIMAKLMFL